MNLLSWTEVMKGLREGKRFRRISWEDKLSFLFAKPEDIFSSPSIRKGYRGSEFSLPESLTLETMEANDWVEVK